MRPLMQRIALLFGLGGLCLGAAIVLAAGRLGPHPRDSAAADPAEVTGSIGLASSVRGSGTHGLPLSDEQRGHIFDGIMKLRDAPVAEVPEPDAATAVPGSVALQELPASVTRDIPMVQGYKFVKLDDRILLVSPVDRTVVAEMPRYKTVLD
jgi:hypothetical protein